MTNGRYTAPHDFEIKSDAWIEAEYAIAFDEKPIRPSLKREKEGDSHAIYNWTQNKPTPQNIKQLNNWLNQGLLPRDLNNLKAPLEKSLKIR